MNPIELAAWTHAEFVRIHPFPDGNGRTSRLIMNYQLLAKRISCRVYRKREPAGLFQCLEVYTVEGNWSFEKWLRLTDQQLDFTWADGAFAGITAESKDVLSQQHTTGMTPDAEMCPALFLRHHQGGRTFKHATTVGGGQEAVHIQDFLE